MKPFLTLALFALPCSLFAQTEERAASTQEPLSIVKTPGDTASEPTIQVKPSVDTASEPLVEPKPVPFAPEPQKDLLVELKMLREKHLQLTIDAPEAGVFLGLVFAAVKDSRFYYPGMPELLMADAIVASGIGDRSLSFDMGEAALGFPVYLQALVVNDYLAGASAIHVLKPVE